MRVRCLAIIAMAVATSSCASTISAYKNRAISKSDLMDRGGKTGDLFVMTGERRVAFAIPEGADYRVCAEGLPDVAAAFGAASTLAAESGGNAVDFTDQSVMSLLRTFNRTENAELFRSWTFTACSAWAQGALEDKHYREAFNAMTNAVVEVMKANAMREAADPDGSEQVDAGDGDEESGDGIVEVNVTIPDRRLPERDETDDEDEGEDTPE